MKRRVICLLLAACMLAAGAVLFSSCTKEDGEVVLSKKTVEVDLSEYALVYPDQGKDGTYSSTFQGNMDEFALAINAATGLKIRALTEKKAKIDSEAPAILVGLTTHEESLKAYESIKDHGYTIKATICVCPRLPPQRHVPSPRPRFTIPPWRSRWTIPSSPTT